jgi:uncharacterized protein (TIGR03435 family)
MNRRCRTAALLAIVSGACCAQPPTSFDVASVKVSPRLIGHDGIVTTGPQRFSARNATLKTLIYEAWQAPYARITGGPAWVSTIEYDIEAKAAHPVGSQELRLMLRTLLADRFKLVVRSEQRESRVYALLADKGGTILPARLPAGVSSAADRPGIWKFHGDLFHFADVLAVQLTIPIVTDPKTPAIARGTPVPVVDKTGIDGIFDFALPMSLDADTDPFTFWQRTLREQLGLKLESRKEPVEFFVIEHAERVPTEN